MKQENDIRMQIKYHILIDQKYHNLVGYEPFMGDTIRRITSSVIWCGFLRCVPPEMSLDKWRLSLEATLPC